MLVEYLYFYDPDEQSKPFYIFGDGDRIVATYECNEFKEIDKVEIEDDRIYIEGSVLDSDFTYFSIPSPTESPIPLEKSREICYTVPIYELIIEQMKTHGIKNSEETDKYCQSSELTYLLKIFSLCGLDSDFGTADLVPGLDACFM